MGQELRDLSGTTKPKLKSNPRPTALDEADLYSRERWNVRGAIYADDAIARG